MKSVRTKIILVVLFGTVLAALAVGTLSMQNARKQIQRDSTELMNQVCQNSGQEIDAAVSRIEQSVETLADCTVNSLSDIREFQSNAAYVANFTAGIENTLLAAAENTEGAVTAYLRFNPDFTEPTSGLFFSRDSAASSFNKLTPTDFSIYDKSDTAHVGWYYIPVQNQKPTWMSPYLNENLQVYMISYVVPIYKDGVSVGVVGMDIDFTLLQDIVDTTGIYESGSAFLADMDNKIMYHKELQVGQDIAELGDGLDTLCAALQNGEASETLTSYTYEGEEKKMTYTPLRNGMKLVLSAPLSEINASTNRLIRQIIVSTVAAVAVSVLISLFMMRGIVRPLEELNRAAEKIAQGDLDVTLISHSKDEIGVLAGSIGQTVERLKAYINYIDEIAEVLEEIAGGNLVFELHYDYAGDFSRIKESLMHISDSLNHTLLEISQASVLVTNGSQQVAAGAQALSKGTSEQAASVEELSGTLYEISEHISRNAGNAQEAYELTVQTGKSVQESNQYMQEMAAAMDRIAEVSGKIGQIVKTVEEIASQTNILALNAAVESARAGEAGKGFSIVAGEVRSLAEKTGSATKDISGLVENVIAAIGDGTAIVGKTEESLRNVVEKSTVIEVKIKEIATASEQQSNTISQINQGVEQISSVVQSNSATAEEDAAVSEEMSGQANLLRGLIGRFNLKDGGMSKDM